MLRCLEPDSNPLRDPRKKGIVMPSRRGQLGIFAQDLRHLRVPCGDVVLSGFWRRRCDVPGSQTLSYCDSIL